MLKLTKAAILAYLKKNRKRLQIWETRQAKTRGMGIPERSFLQRDPVVRAGMGKKRLKEEVQYDRLLSDFNYKALPAHKKLTTELAKTRTKVTSAVKKFRSKGGKLSEYKEPNPVYKTVRALRKIKAKRTKKRKTEAPTVFNYPR